MVVSERPGRKVEVVGLRRFGQTRVANVAVSMNRGIAPDEVPGDFGMAVQGVRGYGHGRRGLPPGEVRRHRSDSGPELVRGESIPRGEEGRPPGGASESFSRLHHSTLSASAATPAAA